MVVQRIVDKSKLIESIKKRSVIKDPTTKAFRKTGASASRIITHELKNYLYKDLQDLRILDFGAGSGRVALPFIKQNPKIKLHCIDVDTDAIDFLDISLPPNGKAQTTEYTPPLPFPGEFFDAVYAISVWAHFPPALGFKWLKELQRVCKKKACLFISKAGYNVLNHWKKTDKQWLNVSSSDLDNEKFIYKEFRFLHSNKTQFPGISSKGSWGNALIHDDYIIKEWAKLFLIERIQRGRMNGMQDLVIMRKLWTD